jgi:hypothetical protein
LAFCVQSPGTWDDKNKTAPEGAERIKVHEEYEVQDWTKKLRVTPEQVKTAVKKAGVVADDIQKELKK